MNESEPLVKLTQRETEVLQLISKGHSKGEIAKILCISYHTVDYHNRKILKKFSTNKMIVCVAMAIRLGILK